MVSNIYTEFVFWACISLADLFASIAVFRLTKWERNAKRASEFELSTRAIPTSLTVSRSFLCLSTLAGSLNFATAYLRSRRIYFLEIPIIPWFKFHSAIPNDDVLAFIEADWIVAFNDWTSLLLATTFLFAASFNFATLGQLWLAFRDQREAGMLLSLLLIDREDVEISDEKATATIRSVVGGGGTSYTVFFQGRAPNADDLGWRCFSCHLTTIRMNDINHKCCISSFFLGVLRWNLFTKQSSMYQFIGFSNISAASKFYYSEL